MPCIQTHAKAKVTEMTRFFVVVVVVVVVVVFIGRLRALNITLYADSPN